MTDPQEEPRVVESDAASEELLDRMPTEESVMFAPTGGGGHLPPDATCTHGWTFVCDRHPPGTTCRTGFTIKCDGATCTTGWTLRCDTTILTCTTGWTFVCDVR